ncbi:MAG: hypothetical protein ACD_3C00198G0009 [uncultured bacterium (gcode 4)]|uniref:Cysteine--tRNA ligase n=1 Tax=uncultured bacterium (gcode 4) TaxID=1234023 RepID=K2GVY1_9BACT|nr:MAG: hypothetical protein ACD_3C00198G0009 [uncultured bacterium (gcode 4)]
MQLTNSLTRKKEKFKPLKEEKVKVYYCWPTPYNYTHIGNLRTYLFSDMAVKALKFMWYKIETTMNLTDIDDKTIRDSIKNGENLRDFTQRYIDFFFDDLAKLNIAKADNISRISDLIDVMVEIINWLLSKWYAYMAEDGSVYYSISKFKSYWELAHLDFWGMKTSVRIDNDEYDKDEAADFVLWKAYDEVKDWPNKWEAKLKVNWEEKIIWGRPGWHIECSACNLKFFWAQIDLHIWAIDLLFPHHQNEVAQTEAFTGKQFSKYWMHAWHLLVDNKKMSKSKGNFYTLRDVEEKMNWILTLDEIYRGFRMMNLQARYDDSFNFTFDKLKQAATTLKTFDEVFKRIKNYAPVEWKVKKEVSENIQAFIQEYISKLEDDFNTPEALATVFEFIKYVNTFIDAEAFNDKEIKAVIDVFKTFNEVLSIMDFTILEKEENIPENIIKLVEQRVQAKLAHDFTLADSIRSEVEKRWYKIVDDKNWSRAEAI